MPEPRHALLIVDVEARARLAATEQAFQSHERVTIANNQEAKDQRARMEDKLDKLAEKFTTKLDTMAKELDQKIDRVHSSMYQILWTIAIGVIALLITIVGFFVVPFFLAHH